MSEDAKGNEAAPTLPAMGKASSSLSRNEAVAENAQLRKAVAGMDERAAGQEHRETELGDRELEMKSREARLNEREAEIEAKGIDPNPAPIASASTNANQEHKDVNSKSIRRQMSQGKRLDASLYEEKYPEKKLLWINDMSGDVNRWIDAGAEPVPVATRNDRSFEGITDKTESKWVRAVGGDDGMGGHFWVYLLMMSPERYDEVELAPLRQRQADIKDAMRRGRNQSDEAESANVKTYAPNLPTGGIGFEKIENHLAGRG